MLLLVICKNDCCYFVCSCNFVQKISCKPPHPTADTRTVIFPMADAFPHSISRAVSPQNGKFTPNSTTRVSTSNIKMVLYGEVHTV